jgi:glycosyltransferase involved in cell wall biosynthesis
MKLSVVIPCYNEKTTIRLLVNSVKEINYSPMGIIVVDDCSTDGTQEILRKEIEPLIDKVYCITKKIQARVPHCPQGSPLSQEI